LRIGQIPYANCTPIFHALKTECDCANYTFVIGTPTRLNRLLREGSIDVAPCSSVEYALCPEQYLLLPDLSISAFGPVGSVLLFSRIELDDLDGRRVGLSADSAASAVLAKILLKERCGHRNAFVSVENTIEGLRGDVDAVLLIGDEALRNAECGMRNAECRLRLPVCEGGEGQDLFVYDLGGLWSEWTGHPFVFALWILRRDAADRHSTKIPGLIRDLHRSKAYAYRNYAEIGRRASERSWVPLRRLVEYWRTISYDLTSSHIEGLRAFYAYAAEFSLIEAVPEIAVLDIDGNE